MTTPRKRKIVNRALELWHSDHYDITDINPSESELRESGYISSAVSELMRDRHRAEIESEYVAFPRHFTVDLKELYQSNGLILGSRHTGKSDVGMLICEKAMKEGTIVVVVDPSLDWVDRSSVTRYMKIKSHTNIEVPSESIIYDISLLSPLEQQRTLERFSKQLFESQAKTRSRKQYLTIFEEAHTYFYQGSMRAKNMQNTVRLLSVGRNIDIACVLISQFPSMLDKFAVKHAISQCWFGFTKEPNDLDYLRRILGETSEELKKLNDGEFLYLDRKGIEKISIEPYESSTAKSQIMPRLEMPSIPKLTHKPKHDGKALGSIVMLLIWLVIVWIALVK